MGSLLSDWLAQHVTFALMHFIWQGAVVAAVLAVVLHYGRRLTSQQRYFASVVALALMGVAPLITCLALDRSASNLETQSLDNPAQSAASAINFENAIEPTNRPLDGNPAFAAALAQKRGFLATVPRKILPVFSSELTAQLQPYVIAGWLAGVLLFSVRLTAAWFGTQWLRAERIRVQPALVSRIVQIGHRLGIDAKTRVFGSTRSEEAVAIGLWRPIVLVPVAWLVELPPDVLEAVIAHELAHIRRHDLWITLVQRIVETMLFYHPAVWWVSRQVAFERELCCDELAVIVTGKRMVYARALETIGRRAVVGGSLVLATSFHGEADMNLLKRVRRVLGLKSEREASVNWPAGLLMMFAAVAFAMSLFSGSQVAQADQKEGAEPRRSAEAEGGTRRSAEGEGGVRRSAEGERGVRKSAEGEGTPRRSAEGEGSPRRSAEGERGAEVGNSALKNFQPQTPREAALMKMIQQLEREMAELRREVTGMRKSDGVPKSGARDGEGPSKSGPRDGERNRDGDRPRDGEKARDGDRPRDGEKARDGERPRDGEKARDGDRPRDGERARDGEARYPRSNDAELPAGWLRTKDGKVFAAYDKNGDLQVTIDEWMAMKGVEKSDTARYELESTRFKEADPNSDGKMTAVEFLYWYKTGRFENLPKKSGQVGESK